MNVWTKFHFAIAGTLSIALISAVASGLTPEKKTVIVSIIPPEKDFFSKLLDYHGIPIKAHLCVSNEALYAASERLSMLLSNQPMALANLVAAGAELHIIGRDQVTIDLPEWRYDKGK